MEVLFKQVLQGRHNNKIGTLVLLLVFLPPFATAPKLEIPKDHPSPRDGFTMATFPNMRCAQIWATVRKERQSGALAGSDQVLHFQPSSKIPPVALLQRLWH